MKTELLRLMQSSMQFSDPRPAIRQDVLQTFDDAERLDVAAIGFSEANRGSNVWPAIQYEARKRGWWFQGQVTGDARFALSPKCQRMRDGFTHVLDARSGFAKGNYSKRGIVELTFLTPGRNVVTVHTTHWLTGFKLDRRPGAEHNREKLHTRQTDAMIERVKRNGRGKRLSFWQGDTNVHEEADTGFDREAIHRRFLAAGLVSIYDELQRPGSDLPPTTTSGPRGRTIDVIGRYQRDVRVKAVSFDVLARRDRNSDHLPVVATYELRLPR